MPTHASLLWHFRFFIFCYVLFSIFDFAQNTSTSAAKLSTTSHMVACQSNIAASATSHNRADNWIISHACRLHGRWSDPPRRHPRLPRGHHVLADLNRDDLAVDETHTIGTRGALDTWLVHAPLCKRLSCRRRRRRRRRFCCCCCCSGCSWRWWWWWCGRKTQTESSLRWQI